MATTLTLNVKRQFDGRYTSSADLTTPVEEIGLKYTQAYAAGEWIAFTDQASSGVPISIDLNTLTNAFGQSINLATVYELWVHNKSTTSGEQLTVAGNFLDVLMGGHTDAPVIDPNGWWGGSSPVDGFTVTNTTADTLTFDSGTDTISADIYILGATS